MYVLIDFFFFFNFKRDFSRKKKKNPVEKAKGRKGVRAGGDSEKCSRRRFIFQQLDALKSITLSQVLSFLLLPQE